MTNKPAAIRKMNAFKRLVDVSIVLLTGPALLILGLLSSGLVLLTLGRPVLFKQARIGLAEREFRLLKLRTMTDIRDAEGALLPDRDRTPAVGRILRRLSLDELPQFLNVLRGDMAIIGPRPLYPSYLPYYREHERKRHWVRPGLTGLAQVSGRNSLNWNERLSLDAAYVETLNPLKDATILAKTIRKVLTSSDVSVIANDSGERLDVLRSYPMQDGLAIRRFERRDIAHRVRLFNDPRIRRYMTLPDGVTVESTIDWLQRARSNPGRRDFVAYQIQSDEVVAMVGLVDRDDAPGYPEMYIMVDPDHQGKGIGRRSLSLLLEWMGTHEKYRGCWLTVDRDNTKAISLYTSLGFVVTEDPINLGRLEMLLDWTDPARHHDAN